MGLRINSNIASQVVQTNLQKVSNDAEGSLAKLSSGKRIVKAADDAAGLAIATNLDAQTRGLKQASRNANDGISLVQTAEGGLNEVSNILVRLRELNIQAASDTIGDDERGFLNVEYQEMLSEIDRIADSTTFNGSNLLNGESDLGTMDFQVGAFAGEQNVIQFNAEDTNTSTDNIGVGGITVESKGDALDAIEAVDTAINNVSGFRANLGAIQSRLVHTVNSLETATINQDRARSMIEDVDVAEETSKLASKSVVKNAGIAALAQANNIPASALRLIG